MSALTVGVLITYHNERDLLRECIESFLSQNPPPDEILIHDDASDAPAEAYLPAGFHGTILHTLKNRGPACARNVLWRESHSDAIHFHDADDIVLPGWSAKVRAAFSDTVDAVFTEIQSRRGSDIVSPTVLGLARLKPAADLVRFCLQGAMLVPSGTYRRSVVQAIHGYRESLWQAEDFDFHIRLAAYLMTHTWRSADTARYRILNEALVEIRLRAGSRSLDTKHVWSDGLKALEQLSTELPEMYAGDVSEAAARIGSELSRIGEPAEAHRAFALAAQRGTPEFVGQGSLYRWVARRWGPERAESWGRFYRQHLPKFLRVWTRALSDRKAA